MRRLICCFVLAAVSLSTAWAQDYRDEDGKIRVALLKMPYRGARNVAELSEGPDYLHQGGIASKLEQMGVRLKPTATIGLTSEEQKDYGVWHRLGLANGHLADLVSANRREGYFSVGLLANCSSLMGVLGGL
ncbi:MAG: hypothetical protein V3T83_12595, partial [Acidobacteriota bacterium]